MPRNPKPAPADSADAAAAPPAGINPFNPSNVPPTPEAPELVYVQWQGAPSAYLPGGVQPCGPAPLRQMPPADAEALVATYPHLFAIVMLPAPAPESVVDAEPDPAAASMPAPMDTPAA